MSNCAVVGINWGDEGKGRMVDLIAKDYDIVIRYQGGNNAGHTIVNEYGKFALHLIPSGIFSEGVVNVLGNGVVIDLEDLCREIDNLRAHGIRITPENLKISERATIVFPFHRALDGLEEARLKDRKYGSTLRGIAPVYSDKYQKKTVMLGELLYPEHLKAHLATILEWKNLIIHNVYGAEPYKLEDMLAWCEEFGGKLRPFLCDVPKYLYEAEKAGKNIMFEAQLGALRDIDFGIYPYTSSSSSIAGYACVGAGMPGSHVDRTVGIVKAYSTCVGEGPFTAEWFGEHAVRRLAADGKCLGQEVVEVLAALIALAELVRLFTQLLIRQRLHLVLHGLDARDERHKLLYFTLRAGAEDFLNDSHRMKVVKVSPRCCIRRSRMTHISSRVMSASGR